jgi:hypothetical protein
MLAGMAALGVGTTRSADLAWHVRGRCARFQDGVFGPALSRRFHRPRFIGKLPYPYMSSLHAMFVRCVLVCVRFRQSHKNCSDGGTRLAFSGPACWPPAAGSVAIYSIFALFMID